MTKYRLLIVIALITCMGVLAACMQQAQEAQPEPAPTSTQEPAVQTTDEDAANGATTSQDEVATAAPATDDSTATPAAPGEFAQVEMGTLTSFTHESGVFSINYPQNWTIEEQNTSQDITTQFYSPERNGLVSITIIEVPNAEQLDAETLGTLLQDTLTSIFRDAENLSLDAPEQQDDGSVRIIMTMDVTVEGLTATMLANSFIQVDGDYVSMILFSLPQDQFDDRVDTINTILNSYVVYPDTPSPFGERVEPALEAPAADIGAEQPVPATDNAALRTYTGPNDVFSISLPPDWEVSDENVADALQVSFIAPDGSGMVSVGITDLGSASGLVDNAGMSELLMQGIEEGFGSYEGFRMADSEAQPDGGFRAEFAFDGPGPIGMMQGVSHAQVDNTYLSMLMVIFSEEQVSGNPEKINTIINSYTVDPAVPLQ